MVGGLWPVWQGPPEIQMKPVSGVGPCPVQTADCSRRVLAIGDAFFDPRSIFDPVMIGQRSTGSPRGSIGRALDSGSEERLE